MNAIDTAYQSLACIYIGGQVKALKRQLRGARLARNIEYVHQARVASRRLRAALRMFADCLPEQKCYKSRRQIRRITKRLGAARDTDVQIDFLKQVISRLPEKSKKLKPGLRRLMLRLKQRRQAIQPKVVRALDRLENKNVLAEIIEELRAISACGEPGSGRDFKTIKSKAGMDVHRIQSPFVFQQAAEHINSRLAELFSFENSLDDPKNAKGQHQMRIAAKRFRYTIEICNLPFENKLAEHIGGIKHLQSLLGKLHDCDMWSDDIKNFSRDEKARMMEYLGSVRSFKRIEKGIDYLVRLLRKDRRMLFEQSAQYWKQLGEQDFWNKLNSIMQELNFPIDEFDAGRGTFDESENL